MKREIESIKEKIEEAIERCQKDTFFKASLKKLSSNVSKMDGWWALSDLGVNLADSKEVEVTSLVFSSIARNNVDKDGVLPIGKAILFAYANDSDLVKGKKRGSARFRRLLSCKNEADFVNILRPLISLIDSRSVSLDYSGLLLDLLLVRYPERREQILSGWAKDFYTLDERAEESK